MSEWWESTLVRREVLAHDTVACVLERPASFTFQPGQYVEMMVLQPPFTDEQGPSRAMSIASAPSDSELVVVMRLRDTAFKRSVMTLEEGDRVLLDGPAEDMSFGRAGDRPVALVAGGVGVAPFRSFLREVAAMGQRLEGALLYSNRRPEDAPYLDELSRLSAAAGLRFVPTMTRLGDATLPWTGERERLSAAMIARHLPPDRLPRYYVSGSTLFVSGLCYDLEQSGVPPRDIAIEMYSGY